MKTKILGRTGLEVPIVGLGTIFIGSQPSTGSANELVLDEDPGAQTVQAAIEVGCTLIDTAPLSGATCREQIIGHVPPQRPDLSATAKIVTATREATLSIPIIALTVREHTPISTETAPQDTTNTEEETEGVFIVQDGIAQFRPVKVGIAGEEHFEVLGGLSEGDTIVAGPYQSIRDLSDSSRVRPMDGSDSDRSKS